MALGTLIFSNRSIHMQIQHGHNRRPPRRTLRCTPMSADPNQPAAALRMPDAASHDAPSSGDPLAPATGIADAVGNHPEHPRASRHRLNTQHVERTFAHFCQHIRDQNGDISALLQQCDDLRVERDALRGRCNLLEEEIKVLRNIIDVKFAHIEHWMDNMDSRMAAVGAAQSAT